MFLTDQRRISTRPRRERVYHGVIGLAVVGALTGGGLASGEGPGGLLGGLLGTGSAGPAGPAAASAPPQPSARLHMPSRKLHKGCRSYAYTYAISVPADDEFDLEIFVTDPRGVSQASDVILSGADPLTGTKSLTICRSNTVPGTFTLRGTMYSNDGAGPTTTTPVPDDRFILHKAHRKHHRHHKHQKRHH